VGHYDLTVCYRIYPRVSKHPPIYENDKLKLSEVCLASFKDSLEGLKVKMIVLLDGCPEIYKHLFLKYFCEEDLVFYELNSVGNQETFRLQLELLLNQNYSEYIYFAEDDYFYINSCKFKTLIDFMKNYKDVDFVTPYYHLDYSRMQTHLTFQSIERIFQGIKFRTVATTTMTFLTKKQNLQYNKKTFLSYTKGNDDASLWLSLTKHKIYNFLLILKYLFKDKLWFKMYLKSWIFNCKQIFLGEKYYLWCPIDTFATHMDDKCLSPNVNWENEFRLKIEKIDFIK